MTGISRPLGEGSTIEKNGSDELIAAMTDIEAGGTEVAVDTAANLGNYPASDYRLFYATGPDANGDHANQFATSDGSAWTWVPTSGENPALTSLTVGGRDLERLAHLAAIRL